MMSEEIPYQFVIDLLYPLPVRTKKMSGVLAIYREEKMVFALSRKLENPLDNGIWVATKKQHHQKLKHKFPSLRSLHTYGIKTWLLLPEDADDFEESAIKLVELVKENTILVGNIPKSKKRN